MALTRHLRLLVLCSVCLVSPVLADQEAATESFGEPVFSTDTEMPMLGTEAIFDLTDGSTDRMGDVTLDDVTLDDVTLDDETLDEENSQMKRKLTPSALIRNQFRTSSTLKPQVRSKDVNSDNIQVESKHLEKKVPLLPPSNMVPLNEVTPVHGDDKFSTTFVGILSSQLVPSKFSKSGTLRSKTPVKTSTTRIPKISAKKSSTGNAVASTRTSFVWGYRAPSKKELTISDILNETSNNTSAIVQHAEPMFTAVLNGSFSNDLALYGPDLTIEEAILEKHVTDNGQKAAFVKPKKAHDFKKSHTSSIKTSFQLKDLPDLPKASQKILKHPGKKADWVAEEEPGVMLPASDGSGPTFVPDLLIRDTEFLLTVATKTSMPSDISHEEFELSTVAGGDLARPGRDTSLMGGMPYSFGFIVDDEYSNNFQTRQEEGDSRGVITGCYQVLEPTNLVRTVMYRADHLGFQVISSHLGHDKAPCAGLEGASQLTGVAAATASRFNAAVNSAKVTSKSSSLQSTAQVQNAHAAHSFGSSTQNQFQSESSSNFQSSSSSAAAHSTAQQQSPAQSTVDHSRASAHSNFAQSSSNNRQQHSSSLQESTAHFFDANYDDSFTDSIQASSTNSFINFPFVLIPVSTFVDLREKGLIDGSVQSFGAFVQPAGKAPLNKANSYNSVPLSNEIVLNFNDHSNDKTNVIRTLPFASSKKQAQLQDKDRTGSSTAFFNSGFSVPSTGFGREALNAPQSSSFRNSITSSLNHVPTKQSLNDKQSSFSNVIDNKQNKNLAFGQKTNYQSTSQSQAGSASQSSTSLSAFVQGNTLSSVATPFVATSSHKQLPSATVSKGYLPSTKGYLPSTQVPSKIDSSANIASAYHSAASESSHSSFSSQSSSSSSSTNSVGIFHQPHKRKISDSLQLPTKSTRAPIPGYLASLSDPNFSLKENFAEELTDSSDEIPVGSQPLFRESRNLKPNDAALLAVQAISPDKSKFKPPTKLESMVDSPVIRSSDWIPMISSSVTLNAKKPSTISPPVTSKQTSLKSVVHPSTLVRLPNLAVPLQATRLPNLAVPQQATRLPNLAVPQQATRLPNSAVPQQATRLPNLAVPQQAARLPSIPNPDLVADASEQVTLGSSLRSPRLAFSHTPPPTLAPDLHLIPRHSFPNGRSIFPSEQLSFNRPPRSSFQVISNGNARTENKGLASSSVSFGAVQADAPRVVRNSNKNSGFGHFHTRESSKLFDADGSSYNSHFYSQINQRISQ